MVGNGVTDWKYDCTPAFFHMSYYHGLISDRLFNGYTAHGCDFSNVDAPFPPNLTVPCNATLNEFKAQVSLVNGYNIFGKCWNTSGSMTAKQYTPFLKTLNTKVDGLKEIPECVYGGPIRDYFNSSIVRT